MSDIKLIIDDAPIKLAIDDAPIKLTFVETAIVTDNGKVKVSTDDTTSDFLEGKISAGAGIALTTLNPGGDETLEISAPGSTTDELAKVSADDTTAGFLNGKLVAGANITLTELTPGGNETLEISAAAGVGSGTPTTVNPGDSAVVGVATDGSREDHAHAAPAAAPSALAVGQAGAEGVGTSFVRDDHAHEVPSATPVAVGTANAPGSSGSFVHSDHVHDHGSQTDPTHHAVAVPSGNAGFLSGTDKAKLDGIASGASATWTGLTDTPGSFTADLFSRVNSGGTALELFDLFGGTNTWTAQNTWQADQVHEADIIPDTDNANRTIGTNSLRFRRVNAQSLVAIGGNRNVSILGTAATNGLVSVVCGNQYEGGGTSQIVVDHNNQIFTPIFVGANTYSTYAGDSATVEADSAGGGMVVGSAFTYGSGGEIAQIRATQFGNFTGGYAYSPGGNTYIRNFASGAFCWAYPLARNGIARAQVQNAGAGAFVQGRLDHNGAGTVEIVAGAAGQFIQGFAQTQHSTGTVSIGNPSGGQSQGSFAQGAVFSTASGVNGSGILIGNGDRGAFVQGYVRTNGYAASIFADADGAFAQGSAVGNSAAASITASGGGALARGRALNAIIQATAFGAFAAGNTNSSGLIEATAAGAFAMGNAPGNNISASAIGAFAMGDADASNITARQSGALAFGFADTYNIDSNSYGGLAFGCADTEAIIANGNDNSFQLGPGTNSIAKSLQVGGASGESGFRVLTTGQHGSPNSALTLGVGVTTFACDSNMMTITGDAGTNTIATITGGIDGQELVLIFVDALVTITDTGTGAADTCNLAGNFVSTANDTLSLAFDGTSWRETSRSVN